MPRFAAVCPTLSASSGDSSQRVCSLLLLAVVACSTIVVGEAHSVSHHPVGGVSSSASDWHDEDFDISLLQAGAKKKAHEQQEQLELQQQQRQPAQHEAVEIGLQGDICAKMGVEKEVSPWCGYASEVLQAPEEIDEMTGLIGSAKQQHEAVENENEKQDAKQEIKDERDLLSFSFRKILQALVVAVLFDCLRRSIAPSSPSKVDEVCWLVCLLGGLLAGLLAGWHACLLAGWLGGCLAGWLVCWLAGLQGAAIMHPAGEEDSADEDVTTTRCSK